MFSQKVYEVNFLKEILSCEPSVLSNFDNKEKHYFSKIYKFDNDYFVRESTGHEIVDVYRIV